jgi:hypothetical protein
MAPRKTHWYNVIKPSVSDPSIDEIIGIFPPLSSLLNIEVMIVHHVLEVCGLCCRKGVIFMPEVQAWTEFIAE